MIQRPFAFYGSAMLFAFVVVGIICGYVVWSVNVRGCNPFLDHSSIGVPICP